MEFYFLLASIVFLHALAVISPGPDFFMVMKNSLGKSRRDGVLTSAGIAVGIGVHIIYCVAGFALIISKSIMLFTVFKVLAGIYLIWIGLSAWNSKGHYRPDALGRPTRTGNPFVEGFMTNVLNPKASLFFLSLFTLVLPPGLSAVTMLLIGLLLIIDTFIWFATVSVLVTVGKVKRFYSEWSEALTRFLGTVLVILGAELVLSKK